MSSTLHSLILEYLPINRRQNTKGWLMFNAPCCHHRGHNPDTRNRGNLLFSADGSVVVNCYNCGFKSMHKNGDISASFESWMHWLGVPKHRIQQAKLEILSKKINGSNSSNSVSQFVIPTEFPEVQLPLGSKAIRSIPEKDITDLHLQKCMEYLKSRGKAVSNGWDYYWSSSTKHDMNSRVIIPFMHKNKIVGWTARYAGKPAKNCPRYFNSELPANYLFNSDAMSNFYRKYIILVEGPFDAIAIDGVGVLGSTLNQNQIAWINSYDKEKIVLPDRESKNQDLIDVALEQGWSVSFPAWEQHIKDAADASKRYGKLYTIASAITAKTHNKLQIGINRKMLKG